MSLLSNADFLFAPVFLRGVSGSLHLALLISLLISSCFSSRFKKSYEEAQKQVFRNSRSLYYKQTLSICVCLSVFNLALCVLSYFYWYELVAVLDFAIKAVSWSFVCVYLHTQFADSNLPKYPSLLRFWWGFYLSVSCYCLVVDVVLYERKLLVPVQSLVSDIVSAFSGLFFVYVGVFGENESDDNILEEPLLNGTSRVVEGSEIRGDETVTPYSKAGIFSILTFSWVGPLIAVGNKKILDPEDVPQLDSGERAITNFSNLKKAIESEGKAVNEATSFKLVKAVFFSVWKEILWTALFVLFYTLASYVGPYLIDSFVRYLSGRKESKHEGYKLVTAFLVANVFECVLQRQWFFKTRQVGLKVHSALVAMIYNKGLTLSSQSKNGYSCGEIINVMTVDVERITDFSWYMNEPWMIFVQVSLALLILYKNVGLAAISTFLATIVVMLANLPLGKWEENFQEKLMASKDIRMKATSEVLRNMRVLKLQGWEIKFLSKIIKLRKTEESWLKKFLYTSSVTTFVFWIAPTFISVVTFCTCMLLGIPLDAGKVLSALATFRILQQPIYDLPNMISSIAQTKVSFDRISAVLRLDDLQPDAIKRLPKGSSDIAIEISNGTFSWDISSQNPTLKDINLRVQNGMRVAVCGMVGSGKSSLLSAILGEVPRSSGTVRLCGTKAYVSQSPWIQSGKIEENILFGKDMDREMYERVLEACSLKNDLEILPFGDQTVIGERGINLSGGQKQRVQLARALYQDADIYLLDDPFSAVDAHTGTHLFNECLMGLLGSKTVIYVTHQVEFLPSSDLILVLREGRISQAGKYHEILSSGTEFMELVGAHKKSLSTLGAVYMTPIEKGERDGDSATISSEINSNNDKKDDKTVHTDVPKGHLVQKEVREKGQVSISVYWKYITTAYGGALVPVILLAQILFEALQIGSNYWMASASPVSEDSSDSNVNGTKLILVYVALSIGSSLCVLIRAVLLVTVGYKTATLLFEKMHRRIFRAPMSFFDATPSGRIINRASTDQSAVDLNIVTEVGAFAFSLIQLVGVIAVMSQVAWQVFFVFIPVTAACIWYQQYYIPSARELARLVGTCKAPVIQHFAETLSGVTTIRSFDQESRFRETNMSLVDGFSRPKFHISGAMEWLGIRLDTLSSVTFAFSLVFLISIPEGIIDPGVAGLAVTYGLSLNMLQAVFIWNLCNMEYKIISVERIFQYTDIQSEPPLVIESNRPGRSWPPHGEVEIRDLQVRYAPHLPLVLQGVTCTFQGGTKTGIVGRTGSGKSTLIQTLLRIVDPSAGQILIDGIEISSIGLHDLRLRLSIIPQDPTMFEGSVRSNLDPLEEYTDEQIWKALDKCQLGDEVRNKEGKLDSSVTENGENWSMGQRQLVCLGRVLLRKSKVLILDEATASVDTATDNQIQQTLRHHFSDCTVITIAHRITSVLDSDMVLLLSQGIVEEHDSPVRLLGDKSSSFSQLVAEYSIRSMSNL